MFLHRADLAPLAKKTEGPSLRGNDMTEQSKDEVLKDWRNTAAIYHKKAMGPPGTAVHRVKFKTAANTLLGCADQIEATAEAEVQRRITEMGNKPVAWMIRLTNLFSRKKPDLWRLYWPHAIKLEKIDFDDKKPLYAVPPQAQLQAAIDQAREEAAVKAWFHFMAACKKRGISPSLMDDFCASGEIRALIGGKYDL